MTASNDDALLPVIRAALDQTRAPACITTADLDEPGPEIVYVNAAYCALIGRDADEIMGLTPRIMQGPLTSRTELDRLRSDLEADRPFIGETVNYQKDGRPFLISWRIDPVFDNSGVKTHYIATQDDITEIRRAQRLLKAEKEIDQSLSELLSGSADMKTNFMLLSEAIVDNVAALLDYGDAVLFGSVRLGTTVVELSAGPVTEAETILAGLADPVDASTVGGAENRLWLACSLADAQVGLSGSMAVTGLSAAELDFTDRSAIERLAESAQRAIQSMAEYERQRLVAIELQRDLLPTNQPGAPGFKVATRYVPGAFATRVGGDWYDVITRGDQVVMMVGDVAGSGVGAAADMGRVRLLMRTLLRRGVEVPEVFAELNRFCAEEGLMATALAVSIQPSDGSLVAVTAGHPPPVIRRRDGAEVLWLSAGPPLGYGGDPAYEERTANVDPGEVVLLFSDGLFERRDESVDRSIQKLADHAADLPAEVEALADGVLQARLAESPSDDIALLAFQSEPEI